MCARGVRGMSIPPKSGGEGSGEGRGELCRGGEGDQGREGVLNGPRGLRFDHDHEGDDDKARILDFGARDGWEKPDPPFLFCFC